MKLPGIDNRGTLIGATGLKWGCNLRDVNINDLFQDHNVVIII